MLTAVRIPAAMEQILTTGLLFRCPACGGSLQSDSLLAETTCSACFFQLCEREGIWLALLPERRSYYARFISEYEQIRAAEGRGSDTSDYYLSLPFRDLSGTNQSQWKIRACTFRYLSEQILPRIHPDARILDLGAGNGWLSYRLALMGLRPVAVDLLVNERDGLAAAKHYRGRLQSMFPCVQAENTRLPFASGQFDAAIFNASFHYAENYSSTLLETMRCLKRGGMIIVADSPWYRKESSGEEMLAERRTMFLQRYGTPSDSIQSQEFLTDHRLRELEQEFGFRWRRHTPFYGLRWAMRPLIARLRGRREPARFYIYAAEKSA
jgi:ubiquinone/menaquinone biosynthesis C-methylase UbiE